MKHWRLEQLPWERFDPARVDPALIPLVKAAAMVERNGGDYGIYLDRVFADDPDFRAAAALWAEEEIQHGEALGRWASLADPGWDFDAAFARYREGYHIAVDATASIRGSRAGELIARCMVETGTSSYYTALAESAAEPLLGRICAQIAADEFRHYKLFYDHLRRYLGRERIGLPRRLRIAAGRIGESEDDELAFAWHCANEAAAAPFDRGRCTAAYLAGAMRCYRFRHVERGVGMIFKAVGLKPRGRLSALSARLAWRGLCWRRARLIRRQSLPSLYPAAAQG
ncbi:MAG: ferritin-like domain-containing protein [Acetobacteraceae bacterium]